MFFYFKATQGYALKDDRFDYYRNLAEEAEVMWGPYHFFQADLDPVRQAKYFYDTVGDYKGLPPAIDFELTYGVDKKTINARLWTFVQEVERLFGVTPVIYTRGYFWNYWIERSSKWSKYLLWVANYEVSSPYLPADWSYWIFWQYTATIAGSVYGVSSRYVDGNYTSLTMEELEELAGVDNMPVPPSEDCGFFVAYVFGDGLRVRTKPNGTSTILRLLPLGTEINVYGTEYDPSSKLSWGKISNTAEEWVALSWVTMKKP